MDISNWGLGQILMLGQRFFGRRYIVSVSLSNASNETKWDISELALPDVVMIWGIGIYGIGAVAQSSTIRLAVGDQLPTATAEMDRLQPLIMGLGLQGPEPRRIRIQSGSQMLMTELRMPVRAQGRRLVMEQVTIVGQVLDVICALVVSGIPKEIPD